MGNITGVALAGAGAALLLAGCGMLGGNKGAVCEETTRAYAQFATSVRAAPATDKARWKQLADTLAGRLDALSAKAEDAPLKKALKEESAAARAAGNALATGDATALQKLVSGTPARIGTACG